MKRVFGVHATSIAQSLLRMRSRWLMDFREEAVIRRDCEIAFRDADTEQKGYLTPEDYKVAVVSLLGYKPSKYEVGSVWKTHCQQGAGLPRETFQGLMLERMKQQDHNELIRQIFLTFDSHCQGFITLENCRSTFKQVVPHMDSTQIEAFFAEVDSNSDGRVSYRDFELMMKHFLIASHS